MFPCGRVLHGSELRDILDKDSIIKDVYYGLPAPAESFLPVDDPPTEVDGPPTMTIDHFNPEPLDHAKQHKAGRP